MEVWFLYEESGIHRSEPFVRVLVPKARLSPLDYLRVFIRLMIDLRTARPDAVVGFLPLGNVFGLTAAMLAGVKNRVASQRSIGTTYGKVIAQFDKALGTTGVYQHIICVSEAVRQSFMSFPQSYCKRLSVVHNGIEWTASTKTREHARQTLGLDSSDFIIATVGRLKEQKNYPFLLRAVAGAPGVTLAIAGEGYLRPELEQLCLDLDIGTRVKFLGELGKNSLRDLLGAADAFVLASLFEGQSNAVLEAMHQGLPILVGDIPEQRETVADAERTEEAALLAPLDDIEAWTTALAKLRDDRGLREELGRRAKAMVERRFSVDRMSDGFERILLEPAKRSSTHTRHVASVEER